MHDLCNESNRKPVAQMMQLIYDSCIATLRIRQLELARQSIIDACAELVTERHRLDFAMREVAERAGMSLRTVYNHFETREELLDALGSEFDRRMNDAGGPNADQVSTRDDLFAAVATNARLFEAMGGISEAFAQMPLADVGRDDDRTERTRRLVDIVAGLMPSVPEEDARAIAIVLRHLFSHRSWFWLTREYGLEVDQVADINNWIIETITEAAERGDLPKRTERP